MRVEIEWRKPGDSPGEPDEEWSFPVLLAVVIEGRPCVMAGESTRLLCSDGQDDWWETQWFCGEFPSPRLYLTPGHDFYAWAHMSAIPPTPEPDPPC